MLVETVNRFNDNTRLHRVYEYYNYLNTGWKSGNFIRWFWCCENAWIYWWDFWSFLFALVKLLPAFFLGMDFPKNNNERPRKVTKDSKRSQNTVKGHERPPKCFAVSTPDLFHTWKFPSNSNVHFSPKSKHYWMYKHHRKSSSHVSNFTSTVDLIAEKQATTLFYLQIYELKGFGSFSFYYLSAINKGRRYQILKLFFPSIPFRIGSKKINKQ